MPPSGPDFYFVHDAGSIEDTLRLLQLALSGGALVLAILALLARALAKSVSLRRSRRPARRRAH